MENIEAKEIGKIFKEARKKTGLSLEEVSRRSRIHPKVINDIETGMLDRLNKLYIKSFLKKYALFLGLNTENILNRFNTIASQIPGKEFSPEIKKEEEEAKEFPALSDKTIQAVLIGVFSVVIIVLLFVLTGRIRAKFTTVRKPKEAVVLEKKDVIAPVKEQKPAPAPKRKKKEIRAVKTSKVDLSLEAHGEVWVKIMEGDNTLFVGILRKGHKKSFKSDRAITVWTGRAEMLDFTVNNHKVGTIADGVIKDIKISSEGITIDGNWVTRF